MFSVSAVVKGVSFLNGCAGTGRVLEANRPNPTLSRFFYSTPQAYTAARGTYCDVRYDAVPLDCGWLVHKWLEKKELLKIMAALHSVGGLFDQPPLEAESTIGLVQR